jgi:hypothetical protein
MAYLSRRRRLERERVDAAQAVGEQRPPAPLERPQKPEGNGNTLRESHT